MLRAVKLWFSTGTGIAAMQKVLRSTGNLKNSFSVSSETDEIVDTGKNRNPDQSELDMIGSSATA